MDNLAFIIWFIIGIYAICFGIYAHFTKRELPFGFWANAEMFEVKDVKAYNKSLGKLWCVFGIVFILLGIPLLSGQNSAAIAITLVGTLFEAIITMAVYVLVIDKKYRR